jgi:predicted NBD/HSP70 family sugar kinase
MVDRPASWQVVVNMLRGGEPISRPQVARALSVSLPTAGSLVKQLLGSGLLVETGRGRSSGGRPAQLVQMNPDFAHAVGLTVARNAIRATAVNLAGRPLYVGRGEPLRGQSPDAVLDQVCDHVQAALEGSASPRVRGIGVAISGLVDATEGESRSFPDLRDWNDVAVADRLVDAFDLPVEVYNDVQAATLAELHYGHGRDIGDLLCLHMGHGLGIGLICGRQLLRGSRGYAGEIGHIVVDTKGPVWYSGIRGCLESVASPPALVRDAVESIRNGVYSDIAPDRPEALEQVTIQAIFAAADKGDRLACDLLIAAGEHIGACVAAVANTLNPEAIVLSGLLASASIVLRDEIARVFESRLLPLLLEGTNVLTSEVADDATGLGAATAVFNRLLLDRNLALVAR